ncbi:MAG TPA: thioredoxin-like domain-containing protein [Acidimicrobiia bacterium]|nr:thioredoxin-like domain-containing protein [Acidimicrobiia bacterium]
MRSSLTLLLTSVAIAVAACTPASEGTPLTTAPLDTTSTTYSGESFAGTVDAPEFPTGLEWINTPGPLTLDDLRGKVVLLDFWTYGCINCIHILPDLERLESEYPDELIVVGVHSAKFPNEGETTNLRDIVQRYDIKHPVVNDKDFDVWDSWGANAWPTVALIDPTGRAVGIRAGEGVYEAVEPVIAGLVAEFDAQQAINRDPIDLALEADNAPRRPVAYPGKVLAHEGRLWISDTGHHRVIEADPVTGDVLAAYGTGTRGSDDGPALEASFNNPHGLTVGDGGLFVADTGNHLIRRIDLATGEVTTVAGTGEQGWPPTSGSLRGTSLASPWAVAWSNGLLYIANAGTHQLWRAELAFDTMGPYVGSAREGTLNGPFSTAELAQPSSLTLSDEGLLYFADSESSAIRVADLRSEETALVIGSDSGLFDFGDVDGTGSDARLQHPLGTAIDGGTLYVADTYNSKIKRVDLTTGTVTTWLGDGAGFADGDTPLFNEPGGLSVADGILYVADTNNHSVRTIDLATGSTSTLILKGIEGFDPPSAYRGELVNLDPLTVASGEASLVLEYELPEGYKVNDEAPSSVVISAGASLASFPGGDSVDITGTLVPVAVPIQLVEGVGTLQFDVTLIYCEAVNTTLCLIDQVRYFQPVEIGPPGDSDRIVLERTIRRP